MESHKQTDQGRQSIQQNNPFNKNLLSGLAPAPSQTDQQSVPPISQLQLKKQLSTQQMSLGKTIISQLLQNRLQEQKLNGSDATQFTQQSFSCNTKVQQDQIKQLLEVSNPQLVELYVYIKFDHTGGMALAEVWSLQLGQDQSFMPRRGSFRNEELLNHKLTIQDDYFDNATTKSMVNQEQSVQEINQLSKSFVELLDSLPSSQLIKQSGNKFTSYVTWKEARPSNWLSSMIPLTNQIETKLKSVGKAAIKVLYIDTVDIKLTIDNDIQKQTNSSQVQNQKQPAFMNLQAVQEGQQKLKKQSNNPFLNLAAGIGGGQGPVNARNRVYSDNVMIENRYMQQQRHKQTKISQENDTDRDLKSSNSKLSDLQQNAFVDVTRSSFSPTSSQDSRSQQPNNNNGAINTSQSIFSSALRFGKTAIQTVRMSIGANTGTNQQSAQQPFAAMRAENTQPISNEGPVSVRQRTYSYNQENVRRLRTNNNQVNQQVTISSEDRGTESIQSEKQIPFYKKQFVQPVIKPPEKNFRMFVKQENGEETEYNLGNTSPIKSLRSQEHSEEEIDSSNNSSNKSIKNNSDSNNMARYYGFLKSKKKLDFQDEIQPENVFKNTHTEEQNNGFYTTFIINSEEKNLEKFCNKLKAYQQRIHYASKIRNENKNDNEKDQENQQAFRQKLNEDFIGIIKLSNILAEATK